MSLFQAKVAAELGAHLSRVAPEPTQESVIHFPNGLELGIKQVRPKLWEVRVVGSVHREQIPEQRAAKFAQEVRNRVVETRERYFPDKKGY